MTGWNIHDVKDVCPIEHGGVSFLAIVLLVNSGVLFFRWFLCCFFFRKKNVTFDSSLSFLRCLEQAFFKGDGGSNLNAAKFKKMGWHPAGLQSSILKVRWRLSMVRCWLRLVQPIYQWISKWFLFPRVGLPRLDPFSGGNQGPSLALPSNMSKTKKVEGRSQFKKHHRFPWRNHRFPWRNHKLPWKKTQVPMEKCYKFPWWWCVFFSRLPIFFLPLLHYLQQEKSHWK